jgi:hypothetical protein
MACDCLENEAKASIFLGIRDGEMRDRWLVRHTGVELDPERDARVDLDTEEDS